VQGGGHERGKTLKLLHELGGLAGMKGRAAADPTAHTFAICERVAEVQALLHDHVECGKHTPAEVVAKAQAILSEDALLEAMYAVGYFPPITPPK